MVWLSICIDVHVLSILMTDITSIHILRIQLSCSLKWIIWYCSLIVAILSIQIISKAFVLYILNRYYWLTRQVLCACFRCARQLAYARFKCPFWFELNIVAEYCCGFSTVSMGPALVTSMSYLFGGKFSMIKKLMDKNIINILYCWISEEQAHTMKWAHTKRMIKEWFVCISFEFLSTEIM